MLKIRSGAFMVVPAVLFLAGCGSDVNDPTQMRQEEEAQVSADVAQAVAATTTGDVAVMTTEADQTTNQGFPNDNNCQRQQDGHYRCPQRPFRPQDPVDQQLDITREVTFLDADGQPQEFFDPITTASVHFFVQIVGERSGGDFSMSGEQIRDFTMSGLEGEEVERTFNGTGSSVMNQTQTMNGETVRSYTWSATTTTTDVVVAVDRQANPWPLSGTMMQDISVEAVMGLEDPQTRSRSVLVEFNGTQFVPMTVGDQMFTLDLATGHIVQEDQVAG